METNTFSTNLKNYFSYFRNMLVSPQARDIVGSYIYEKMGRSGLIITIQDFKHEMPLKAFADQIGAPILGVSAYPIFIITVRAPL